MIGRSSIGRVLGGVLVFQLFIAGFLIIGDMREGIRLPSFGPSAPRTSEPVRPGDQRRLYSPDYERRR